MADTQWTDFLLRTNTGDTGKVPGPGPASACPDIIPWGPDQVADPQTQFSANYSSNPGRTLLVNTVNSLYVRSKNLGGANNTGRVSLFYAESSYLLWPHDQGNVKGWSNNVIIAADGRDTIDISAAATNDIAVTPRPFLWNPAPPAPGTHYCLIAGVATEAHPQIVPTLDEVTTSQDWSNWVLNHRNVGWRNVALSDSGAATSSRLDNFQNGTTDATFKFNIGCTNCPIGWQVELITYNNTNPAPTPPIRIAKTTITDDTFFGVYVQSLVPAGYFTLLAVNIYSNGIQPSKRWDVSIDATQVVDTAPKKGGVAAAIPVYKEVVLGGVGVDAAL